MFESRVTKLIIAAIGIVIVLAVTVSSFSFTTLPMANKQDSDVTGTSQSLEKQPAPMKITIWGNQTTLDQAKKMTGMTWVSLPTLVPTNLTLAPVRAKIDTGSTRITAIYIPPGISTSDNETGEQVANAGGFSITYWKWVEAPGANQTRQMEKVHKQFPNTTSLETINGHLAVVSTNEIQMDAGTCMNETNCALMIDIGSRVFNSTELRTIAESIAILPHT